jgi:hypothetical protein
MAPVVKLLRLRHGCERGKPHQLAISAQSSAGIFPMKNLSASSLFGVGSDSQSRG